MISHKHRNKRAKKKLLESKGWEEKVSVAENLKKVKNSHKKGIWYIYRSRGRRDSNFSIKKENFPRQALPEPISSQVQATPNVILLSYAYYPSLPMHEDVWTRSLRPPTCEIQLSSEELNRHPAIPDLATNCQNSSPHLSSYNLWSTARLSPLTEFAEGKSNWLDKEKSKRFSIISKWKKCPSSTLTRGTLRDVKYPYTDVGWKLTCQPDVSTHQARQGL